ncbi:MAG: dihydroorotate dehydrogenase PyrD [Sulfolobales archaeon]|nr:dihydroorotate dehydrogenase PyrD [Sulfolobales archaeon]MDW7969367.1 dihydroorotate dehydrogenase PyrD [Sulfolobales archaeon]
MDELVLETSVSGVRLKHPVMVGSGVLGDKPELIIRLIEEGSPAAVVTKTLTKKPREGYLPPVIVELGYDSYLNAVGLANPGIEVVKDLVNAGIKLSTPVIVSIAGSSIKEFAELAVIADEAKASAVELNLSCPHVRGLGAELGKDAQTTYEVVRNVSSSIKIPTWVKLGPWDNLINVAGKSLEGGADALVLINTLRGMKIDIYSFRPILTARIGGLSGRALHPVAVRAVYEVYREFKCDIVGVGGVFDHETALELILAGAKAVQVVSAVISYSPSVIVSIVESIKNYMTDVNVKSITELVGLSHKI